MPKTISKPAALRDSWRPHDSRLLRAHKQQLAVRLTFTTILLMLAGLALYLIFSPLFHPNTQLYFITTGARNSTHNTPVAFFPDDAYRFLTATGAKSAETVASHLIFLESPESFAPALDQVTGSLTGPSDVAVVHLALRPVMINQKPYLRCDNYDPVHPLNGAVGCEELVQRLESVDTGHVLLLLDTGTSDKDQDLLIDDIQFHDALESLIRTSTGNQFTLIASHSPGEQSYYSTSLRGSIFALAASAGLAGAADLNRNRQITIDELYQYLNEATETIVQRESGQAASQHPRVLAPARFNESQVGELVISSAPPANLLALGKQYGKQLSSATGGSKEGEQPQSSNDDATSTQNSFISSFTDYTFERAEDFTDDLRNDLFVSTLNLPKPLARGIYRSVGKAEQLAGEVSSGSDNPESAAAGDSTKDDASSPSEVAAGESSESTKTNGQTETPSPDVEIAGFPDVSTMGQLDSLGLVRLAWELTSYFENLNSAQLGPNDLAPQAWSRWRSYLHAAEERIRAHTIIGEAVFRLELTSEIVGAFQLAARQKVTVGRHMKEIAEETATLPIQLSTITSLGMLSNLQRFQIVPLPDELDRTLATFQEVLTSSNTEVINKWINQLSDQSATPYLELQYARLLTRDPDIPWTVTKQLLSARYQFEALGSNPLGSAIESELMETHQQLLHATRLALDHLDSTWLTACQQALEQSQASLSVIQRKVELYQQAWRWRNQVFSELPALLTWQQVHQQRFGDASSTGFHDAPTKQLSEFLISVKDLSQTLNARGLSDSQRLDAQFTQARQQYSSIVQSWFTQYNRLLSQSNGSKSLMPTDAWTIDALLSTPLVTGQERRQLLQMKIKPGQFGDLTIATGSVTPGSRIAAPVETKVSRAQFFLQLLQLAGVQPAAQKDDSDHSADLQQLPNLVSSRLSTRPEELMQRLSVMREIDTAARLLLQPILPADVARTCAEELWRAELAESCRMLRATQARALEDALPEETPIWLDNEDRLRKLQALLSKERVSESSELPSVTGQGSTNLVLVTQPQASGQITWRNMGSDVSGVWIAVDYDRDALELLPDSSLPIYHVSDLAPRLRQVVVEAEQQLLTALATTAQPSDISRESIIQEARSQLVAAQRHLQYPVRPLEPGVAPSSSLAAGQSLSISYAVRRLSRGTGKTKVIWKLISSRDYVRYPVEVELSDSQKIRLVSEGSSSHWTAEPNGLVLHPWPNRPAEFRLGLINEGTDRTVSMELLALKQRSDVSLPDGFVSAELSQTIANRLGNYDTLTTIAEIALPAKSTPNWISLKPPAAASPKAEDTDGYSKSTAAPDKGTANAKAKSTPIKHGLIAVVTDKASGSKLWRRIDYRVRHPRGYIQPRVRYDSVSQRIVIQLRTLEGQELPQGEIRIHGYALQKLPGGTEQRLDAVISGPAPVELYCQIPPRAGHKVTMALDVDQFPRAFVFDVPCWQTQNDIPLTLDHQRVAITSPDSGLVFPASSTSQEVALQVDAFPGSFVSRNDYVEIGWDLDRDREFVSESTLRINNDRDVEIDLLELKGDRLSITSQVKDLKVSLPAPAIRAAQINLLARMRAGGENVWSMPVEVIADDQAPQLKGIELLPDVVVKQGTDLVLRIGVEDRNLSGIASVKLAVDTKSTGQWDPQAPAIECTKAEEGTWTGTLPTGELIAGRINVLVRATDRAGNESQTAKTYFELVSADDWQARQATLGVEVSGSINYSGGPLAKARISLENDKGKIVYQTLSNAQGLFHVDKVAPGKYKLVGIGVAKNRPRRTEMTLEVKEPPTSPVRLQLQAK